MQRIDRVVLLLCAACSCLPAQTFSFGIKGGVPLNDATTGSDESPRYLVGPSVEVKLPHGLALEVDALYRRVGETGGYAGNSVPEIVLASETEPVILELSPARYRGNSWEFPALGKYYFRSGKGGWQPFGATGLALRTTSYTVDTTQVTINPFSISTSPYRYRYTSGPDVGAVFSGGVRFHVRRFAVAPEFRYTIWGSSDPVLSRREASVMLGISY